MNLLKRMVNNIAENWKRGLRIDGVLIHSKIFRGMTYFCAILLIPTWGIYMYTLNTWFFLISTACVFETLFFISVWMGKATVYIDEKENEKKENRR